MHINNSNKKQKQKTKLEKFKTAGEIDFKVSSMLMVSLNKIIFRRNKIMCKKTW